MEEPIKNKVFSTIRVAVAAAFGLALHSLVAWGIPEESIGPTFAVLIDSASFILGTAAWYGLARLVESAKKWKWLSRLLLIQNPTLQ